MRLWQQVLNKFRPKKSAPPISRHDAMQIMPIRNPSLEWELNEDGNAVISLPRRQDLKGRILTFFFSIPESRPVVLDEVGSFVWQRCDGEHNMHELVTSLRKEYRLNPKEVQVSLLEYMKMLGARGMIAVAVPKEIIAKLDESTTRQLKVQEMPAAPAPPTTNDTEDSPEPADTTESESSEATD